MVQYRILAASYTHDIYTLIFDPIAGTLSIVYTSTVGHHPSWITPYPGDNSLIFTGLEEEDAKVLAMKYNNAGEGTVMVTIPSGGTFPCSLLASKEELFIANYETGGIAILPITPTAPFLLCSSPTTIEWSGSGPNQDRQTRSHPHQVVLIDEYQELLVPDLGADKVFRLKKSPDGSWKIHDHIQYEPGSGPRHIVFHDGYLYTVLELTNKVTKHRLPPLPSPPQFITSLSTFSDPPPAPPNTMFAAEILLPKLNSSFLTPYIYVSNRNDPSPDGDCIAIFSISDNSGSDALRLVNEIHTGLKHVRGMAFGGPEDKWLAVGGVNAGGVRIFERVDGGRNLKLVAVQDDVEAPTGFLWL
ncbi:hypothetical protein AMATHDRAFT_161630 [Amanita thiersii Skay4041]|uniref:Isomerase YbhE n=1 Tax=Amanita thiersii Skay4041 TaxID=703135 RepID=A0A2A9NBX0_9AGAR|nr:hypothetical protein AMATHDRAFT_161630 [Amanita thiersii Skay4041]